MSEPSNTSNSTENAALALRIVDDQTREFRTKDASISLGADPACTIQLSGDEVAPLHCLIVRDQNQTLIRNLSENSLLNEQPFRDEVLGEGDVIRIADTTIEVLSSSVEQLSMEQPEPVAALSSSIESAAEIEPAAEGAPQAFESASEALTPSVSEQRTPEGDFAAAFGSGVIGASVAQTSNPTGGSNSGTESVASNAPASPPAMAQSMIDAACETSNSDVAADRNLRPEFEASSEPALSAPSLANESPAEPNTSLEEDPFEALKRMSAQAAKSPVVEPVERELPALDEPRNDDGSVDVSSILSKMGTTVDEAPAEPVVAPTAPAPFTPEEPQVEADGSIEDYMRQLLQRNGIESGAVESSKPEAVTQPVEPQKPQAVSQPDEPSKPEFKMPKKRRPRVAAPERASDLTALRELANQSSRTAITRHARTSRNEKTLSSFLGGIACALCGLIMLVLSNFDHILFMLIGFGMIALSGFLMLQAVKAGVFTRVKFKPKGPAGAKDTGVPHQRRRRRK